MMMFTLCDTVLLMSVGARHMLILPSPITLDIQDFPVTEAFSMSLILKKDTMDF
jgi:hypothetical protein